MDQAILKDPQNIILKNVEIPNSGPGQVGVKVERVGICGSDIHAYQRFSLVEANDTISYIDKNELTSLKVINT